MDHQVLLLLQAGVTAQEGVRIDLPWLLTGIATVITSLVTAVGITYRGQIKALTDENKRKDQLIDKLIVQVRRTADVQDRTLTVVEERGRAQR